MLQAKIDHPFGAPSPKQQKPQEAKIDEEMFTDECSTIGLIGLLQAHWKAVHDDFEEQFAALNQKIEDLKDDEDDGCKERFCQELERMESEPNNQLLTRFLTST
ncbi:hypothetical protein BDR22DRAFT_888395 [Usnea florida]